MKGIAMEPWPNGTNRLATPPDSWPSSAADLDAESEGQSTEQLGAVRIARRVLRTVVEQAALHVPGVARMAPISTGWQRRFGRSLPQHGVGLAVRDEVVSVDLYIIVEPGVSMVDVGAAVQEAVGAAVEHILGMRASEINVFIQDVA
jgi:uncharacterized alkaline shock family protein YloU